MANNLDETELARLEALARAAGAGDYLANYNADDSAKYAAAACNAVPALVAEVRRLREDVCALRDSFDCEHEALMRHEHMVAELMKKVEAWEWFEECFEVMQWLVPMGPNRADGCTEAVMSTLHAQKRAVHADRE